MNPVPRTFLLTRPKAQSLQFAQDLRTRFGQDIEVVISPMLEIVPVETPLDLQDTHTLIFTSVNGVSAFTRQQGQRDLPCLCVGSRTANAARGFGFSAQSATGNGDDLIALIQKKAPIKQGHYLHIRGWHAAQDMAGILNASGIKSESAVLYDQIKLPLNDAAEQIVIDQAPIVLPLYSPRSAEVFLAATQGLNLRHVRAVCLSSRVAKKLDSGKFEQVTVAAQPNGTMMMDAIAATL